MKVMTFAEWLEKRDNELYQEIQKRWWVPPIVATGLAAGGLGVHNWLQAPKYQAPPNVNPPAQVQTYAGIQQPQQQQKPLNIQMSGEGPFILNLEHYEILDSSLGEITVTPEGQVSSFTMFGIKSLINRNTATKVLKPGKTGDNLVIGTGGQGKEIRIEDEEVTLVIKDRTFRVEPNIFPKEIKSIVDKPLMIQVSDGWIKLRGTGVITIGGSDVANR